MNRYGDMDTRYGSSCQLPMMVMMKSTFISRTLYVLEQTHLSDNLSQPRVAHDQPTPGCDAVGLVLKLLRVDVIEILEPGVGEEP